jgi:hypothetical protein
LAGPGLEAGTGLFDLFGDDSDATASAGSHGPAAPKAIGSRLALVEEDMRDLRSLLSSLVTVSDLDLKLEFVLAKVAGTVTELAAAEQEELQMAEQGPDHTANHEAKQNDIIFEMKEPTEEDLQLAHEAPGKQEIEAHKDGRVDMADLVAVVFALVQDTDDQAADLKTAWSPAVADGDGKVNWNTARAAPTKMQQDDKLAKTIDIDSLKPHSVALGAVHHQIGQITAATAPAPVGNAPSPAETDVGAISSAVGDVVAAGLAILPGADQQTADLKAASLSADADGDGKDQAPKTIDIDSSKPHTAALDAENDGLFDVAHLRAKVAKLEDELRELAWCAAGFDKYI